MGSGIAPICNGTVNTVGHGRRPPYHEAMSGVSARPVVSGFLIYDGHGDVRPAYVAAPDADRLGPMIDRLRRASVGARALGLGLRGEIVASWHLVAPSTVLQMTDPAHGFIECGLRSGRRAAPTGRHFARLDQWTPDNGPHVLTAEKKAVRDRAAVRAGDRELG